MKTYLLGLLCLSFITSTLFAQDSTLENDATPWQKPQQLMVVKGEEFRRFPSGNFLDALNGVFPWVFSQHPTILQGPGADRTPKSCAI